MLKLAIEAASPLRARAGTASATVAEQCAALLFAEALKPLAASLGFYGDIVVTQAALAAARGLASGRR